IALFAGILFIILVIIDFNNRLEDLNRLQKQDGIFQAQATQGIQTQIALQAQATYAASDQAVQDWARTEGGYAQPGDQIALPVGPTSDAPVQQSEAAPSPTPMPNWQNWWNLFFGNQ
ncbi:MAG: hypothetical protein WBW94_09690, partial [Anaerolineales bacterium]